jgi:ADP-ribose pyrophosphatase YjhB (NUDIX family)
MVVTGSSQFTGFTKAVESASSFEPNINAGALIYSKSTQRFLFLLRNASKKYKGTCGLVGGRVESSERPAAGLLREINEELSVDLSEAKIVPIETFTNEKNGFVYHTYMILVDKEFTPILNGEHRGYAWVELDDYPRPLHPGVWKTFSFKSVIAKINTLKAVFIS